MSVVRDGALSLLGCGAAEFDVLDMGSAEFGQYMVVHEGAFPAYTGETVVTPGLTAATLPTANTTVYSDIVINPIPSNYGLITWNGSTLTVS